MTVLLEPSRLVYHHPKQFTSRKAPPVYISKISLKNIRGFEVSDFDLDRGDGNSRRVDCLHWQ